jgi:parallel beta-helix repeat protein
MGLEAKEMNTYNKVAFGLLVAAALCGTVEAETLYVNETGWWDVTPVWQQDSAINSSLGDIGGYSYPAVFNMSGTWYLISGEYTGGFHGFNWTGSTWQQDSAINSSLGDIGSYASPAIFQKDSTWYMIAGETNGTFLGFNWTGSAWQQDSAINASLGDIGDCASPTVFNMSGTWYLISGEYNGGFIGFNWTGSAWQQDSAINASLGDIGYTPSPMVFQKDSTWYLISGENDGGFLGFNWTGSAWQQDSAINASLGDIGWWSAPAVFQKDGTWYLISGEHGGNFLGFEWSTFYTSATPIQHAVDNANTGDTIYIWNGSYTENVDISTTNLTIEGEGRDVVSVAASASSDHVFDVTADYVNITGIKATGASVSNKAGIYLDGADNCNISYNNLSSNHRGVYLFDGANNNLISNNIITSNLYYGIQLSTSCELNSITQNTMSNDVLYNIILSSDSNNNSITYNTATGDSNGIESVVSSWNNITYNNFTNCRNGISIANSNHNIISHNILNNSEFHGAYIRASSYNNTLENNTVYLNGAEGIYLDSAGSDNNITNNKANSNGESGVRCTSTNNAIINDNNLKNNTYGVRGTNSNNTEIKNNILTGNSYDGVWLQESNNNTITGNNVSLNIHYGVFLYISCLNNTVTDNIANNNRIGVIIGSDSHENNLTNNTGNNNSDAGFWLSWSNNGTLTNNTGNNNSNYGVRLRGSSNILFTNHASNDNSLYDYLAWNTSTNNTLLNCDLSNVSSMMNDSTSQWIIKYTDGRILDTDDPALSMTCSDDNCTLTLEPGTNDYTINMTTLDVTVSADTGSVSVSANSTLVSIDYINSTINDLNITALDRQLILESAGVQTMIFDPTNIFNLWNFEYYVNATANRKAVAFNTYSTNATNLINFTFYDLYPSSNFDCKYNSSSFTTNTSSTTGTLEFNKSAWDLATTQAVEIYMTTTPYRCSDGVCTINEGTPMTLYLDLNDTSITHVRAEITKPNGNKANSSMTDFLDDGATSWYINYADTGATGTYTVNNFFSSKDGSTWKQLDSFLTFTSKAVSGGGGGAGLPDTEVPETEVPAEAAGAGATPPPELEPEEHVIKPAAQFSSILVSGTASFNDSYVVSVETNQSGTVQIDEYLLNPTTTSLIDGTRYGYVDIMVPNPNIGGTICFATPPKLAGTLGIYQLDNNEWMELETTQIGSAWCVDVAHFSYFAIADPDMESVIESLTQLSFSPPKVSGILVYGWLADSYVSTHVGNRELANVSASDGLLCEIISTGDYPNRTLQCTYTPHTDADWHTMKYSGEIIAVDREGYTRRIPVTISIYNMAKLAFPMFVGVVLIGGIILYRRYD